MKTRQEIERQIENHLVAQAMMMDIPDKHIVQDLWAWVLKLSASGVIIEDPTPHELGQFECGSAACFGGWCAIHPHFIAQGVRRGPDGAPYHQDMGAADHLFGSSLFLSRKGWEKGSDKAIIMERLRMSLGERCRELAALEKQGD